MSVPPPKLRITLGRRAYRWPFRIFLAALAVSLAVFLSMGTDAEGWESADTRQILIFYGGGGALVALAAAAWGIMVFRTRLIVTVTGEGLVLRRGNKEASIPAGAVDAVGITWPVDDPVLTVWFDPEEAPGVDAVAKVGTDGRAATLFRSRFLRAGRLKAVRTATTQTLGAGWRVLDDEGREMPPPAADALPKADHVMVDGTGRYREERGGGLLAVACGRLAKRPWSGPRTSFRSNPNLRGRTIVLRDPHSRALLTIRRPAPLLGVGPYHIRVLDADGRLIGHLRGRAEPSFHGADGMLLGNTRQDGDRLVVTGVDGRESASLRTKSRADNSRMWLERSPSAPEQLRTLTLALPIALRFTRQI